MTTKTFSNGILRSIGILVGIIGLIWFLIQIQAIIIYIIISAVLALVSRPLTKFLTQKLKFKNTLAVITTIFVYSVFVFFILSSFTPLISKQSENISLLNSETFKENISHISREINEYLLDKNINILEKTKDIDFSYGVKSIPNILNLVLSKVSSFSIGLFSVLFITFFLMLDSKILSRALYAFIPKKHIIHTAKSTETIKNLLSRYFIGLIAQISVLFIIYAITLTIFDIEYPIIIAFLCALFNLIPYVGPLIGAVIIFIFSATNNLELDFQTQILPNTLYVLTGYAIAQLVDNFVSQPLIFSKSVKSHPLEIFLVILIFGNLFGILGMVISIPTYTAIKVIAKVFFSKYKVVELLTKKF